MDLTFDTISPRWRTGMWAGVAVLLLVPLVAMQFTAEVRWTPFDFAAAAVLLGGAAIGCELAMRALRGRWRIVGCGAVVAILALLWAQGAVGVF